MKGDWDPVGSRLRNLQEAHRLGYPRPPIHFPTIEPRQLRGADVVTDRLLALNIVINCAFGMPVAGARNWIAKHGLGHAVSKAERGFIDDLDNGAKPDGHGQELKVEAAWALAWALKLTPTLRFDQYCGDQLASYAPNLRDEEGPERVRAAARLRPVGEVLDALDLVYCLSWGVANANLTHAEQPGTLRQYVIWERRRALEWLVGGDWDDSPFDT